MGGVAVPPEHRVRCLAPQTKSGGDEELRLMIDERPVGVKLRVGQLNAQLVEGLPDRAFDLLEIASLVYGADTAISRGGASDQQMGHKWHRRIKINIPVRDQAFWERADVVETLEETLMFLSGDRFMFTFSQKNDPEAERSRFFRFDKQSAWQAQRVLMFSGGLDSFAGALEEIAEHRQRVALVSHFSASKMAPVPRKLQAALAKKFGPDCCRHVPVQVQMVGSGTREGTHRSRSFLFAALGAITAEAFGLDRVSFYENGVVSLNLPPVGNVLGTRATRTTHPQTLARFSAFFDKVFENGKRVDNPFFWRTKTDVVETIARLEMKEQIVDTRSCADVHNQTRQYPNCGRCSQCIDRRFAILAAGLQASDPEEAYRVALMEDPRGHVVDREVALSYVRNAQVFEHVTPEFLEQAFPAVLDAVGYLGYPPETALSMISKLLNRHGAGVSNVMRYTLNERSHDNFPEGSLPRLYGDAQRDAALPMIEGASSIAERAELRPVLMEVDERRKRVTIDGRIDIVRNAAADLLIELSKAWLDGAGSGADPLDFPCIDAKSLTESLGASNEEALRRRVMVARRLLRDRFQTAGLDAQLGENLIENLPWSGYRLAPDRVIVRKLKELG